jgi:ABC-2 type transport system permease protein
LNTFIRLVYRNFRANLDPGTLFFEIIFPLFFIFIQGFAFSGIVPPFEVAPGVVISYPLFLAAGAITFTVVNGGTTAGQQLWFDRKSAMFEQILMGPFTKAQYILSIIISTILIGLSGATIVFVLALPVLFGSIVSAVGFLASGVVLILGSFFFGSMAIALSVRLRSAESFQIISTFIFFVFLFTSSIFYPVDRAPGPIQSVAYANPLTYIADIFRSGLFGYTTPNLIPEILALLLESLAMFALAVLSFRRIRV